MSVDAKENLLLSVRAWDERCWFNPYSTAFREERDRLVSAYESKYGEPCPMAWRVGATQDAA